MIDLITGLPGNCKTLYTIAVVKDWAAKDNRPVFYSGIPELTLPWTEIDPEKWMECPPGSIVVIDECQRVYRNRSINAQAPKYVTDLETHRHQGIDLVFITQHPMLIDPALRRLVGRHRHCVRKWGMEASTIHEWAQVRENCDKPAGRKDSIKHHWKFDKSVYGLYKSAEVHTVKRNIPMKVKLLFLLPLLLAALVWKAYGSFQSKMQLEADKKAAPAGVMPTAPVRSNAGYSVNASPLADPVMDAKLYTARHTPRVQGLPHTAPIYDEITKPQVAPVPVACVSTANRCLCYSQQGTRMDVRDQTCRDIAEFGYFQAFDVNGREGKGGRAPEAVERSKDERITVAADNEQKSNEVSPVRVMERDGFGVLGKKPGA